MQFKQEEIVEELSTSQTTSAFNARIAILHVRIICLILD